MAILFKGSTVSYFIIKDSKNKHVVDAFETVNGYAIINWNILGDANINMFINSCTYKGTKIIRFSMGIPIKIKQWLTGYFQYQHGNCWLFKLKNRTSYDTVN